MPMIFNDLTPEELAAVERNGVQRDYARGAIVLREGEAGSSFFLVLQGRVEVRKRIGDDKYRKLAELGPLEVFGEVCFLGVESRSASVLALEPTTVLEFSRDGLEALMAANPVIGHKLYRGLACELARRLAVVDTDLKDAIMWALGDLDSASPVMKGARKLAVRPPASSGEPARLVIT